MICRNPNCSMENPDYNVFCQYCGRRLREPQDNSKKPLMILIGVAAAIILIISVKAMFGGSAEPKNNNAKVPDKVKNNEVVQVSKNNNMPYKLAFIRGYGDKKEVYITKADGTEAKLTKSNAVNKYPSWSSNGEQLVFERISNNVSYVYVINADGTGEKKITEGHEPTWAPDGRIMFYNKDPNSISNFIYSIKPDGSDLKQVTKTSDSYYMASYSNDNSKVALIKYSQMEGWGLYTVNALFESRKTILNPIKADMSSPMVGEPSWSVDGTKVAFYNKKDGNSEIYVVDLNNNTTRITNNPVADYSPSWTKDGKIVFTREELGGFNLYVVDADGKNEKMLLKDAAYGAVYNR